MLSDFRLKVFETVAAKKNFTKAAKELGISQPAVSQNISELEQQIGDTLFVRGLNQVELTVKGALLLDYTHKILHLYESLNSELVPSSSPSVSLLKIGACPLAAKFILPPVIERFKDIFPRIEVVLLERENFEMESLLSQKAIDLSVSDKLFPGFESEPFIDISLSGGAKNIQVLYFAYSHSSGQNEEIRKFIMTSKTCI